MPKDMSKVDQFDIMVNSRNELEGVLILEGKLYCLTARLRGTLTKKARGLPTFDIKHDQRIKKGNCCFVLNPDKTQKKSVVSDVWLTSSSTISCIMINLHNPETDEHRTYFMNNQTFTQVKSENEGEQIHFKDQSSAQFSFYGVDQNDDLWIWGQLPYMKDDTVVAKTREEDESTPQILKWFKDRDLKVREVKNSKGVTLLRMYKQSQPNEDIFYCIPRHYEQKTGESAKSQAMEEAQWKDMCGRATWSDQDDNFKESIVKMNIKPQGQELGSRRVLDLGMTDLCSFAILEPEADDAEDTIDSLYYYYKSAAGNWEFTKDKNDANLPAIHFFTRYRLVDSQERDLEPTKQLDAALEKLTALGLDNGGDQIYNYAHFVHQDKKDKPKQIKATDAELESGGQSWDMNPIIFYRVKKQIDDLK